LEVGFDAVGFAPAELGGEAADNLRDFIARGYHGEMAWMPEKADRRIGPTALWPEAKSVIALGMNYAPAEDPLALAGRIAASYRFMPATATTTTPSRNA
jgi:epoxyqueuosine reductase